MPKRAQSEAEAKLAGVLEYQRALAAFSRVSGESMDPNRLMQHATAQVSALTHIGRVKVMRYRPDQGDLLVEAGVGWKLGVIGRATLGIDHASPPGRAIQTGMAVAIHDLPNDPEFRVSGLLAEHEIVSVINVPILIDGQTWGVLEADASTPRCFDEVDVPGRPALRNRITLWFKNYCAVRPVSPCTFVTGGGFHLPMSTSDFGAYMRINKLNGALGAGSQFASLSFPGLSCWRYRSSEPSALYLNGIQLETAKRFSVLPT